MQLKRLQACILSLYFTASVKLATSRARVPRPVISQCEFVIREGPRTLRLWSYQSRISDTGDNRPPTNHKRRGRFHGLSSVSQPVLARLGLSNSASWAPWVLHLCWIIREFLPSQAVCSSDIAYFQKSLSTFSVKLSTFLFAVMRFICFHYRFFSR